MLADLLDRTPPRADRRIHYRPGDFQFGDLWLPAGGAKRPLVVFLHGGWWRAQYDLAYGGHLCAALRAEGLAVWSVEYRRVGDAGGGWPGTFQDVAAGFDFVANLAEQFPIERTRVVAAGHSAGGHLAFWLAGAASCAAWERGCRASAAGGDQGVGWAGRGGRSAVDDRPVGASSVCA